MAEEVYSHENKQEKLRLSSVKWHFTEGKVKHINRPGQRRAQQMIKQHKVQKEKLFRTQPESREQIKNLSAWTNGSHLPLQRMHPFYAEPELLSLCSLSSGYHGRRGEDASIRIDTTVKSSSSRLLIQNTRMRHFRGLSSDTWALVIFTRAFGVPSWAAAAVPRCASAVRSFSAAGTLCGGEEPAGRDRPSAYALFVCSFTKALPAHLGAF